MRIAHFANRSFNSIASLRPCHSVVNRSLSTNVEKDDYFEKLFGGSNGNDENSSAFFQHLGRAEKQMHNWKNLSTPGGSRFSAGNSVNRGNGDQSFDSSSDGMDGKLKEAALFFKVDEEEGAKDSYLFRSDAANSWGGNFKPRNVIPRARQNNEFKITTEAVLKQADFRNVKFLAKFITEAGIIIKRKQTGISAKAQRKIAREIKTARAFGLMPFTTMGTKAFVYGKSMENRDEDFEYEAPDDEYDEE